MKYVRAVDLQSGDTFMEDTSPEIYECVGPDPENPEGIIAKDIRTRDMVSFFGSVCLILLSRTL